VKKLLAVIIKGNSRKFKKKIHHLFYSHIKTFLESLGYKVEFDDGLYKTMPRKDADLYVCHSRGCSRVKWFTTEQKRKTCVLGATDYYGVLNDEDKKCYPNRESSVETARKYQMIILFFLKKCKTVF